MTSIRGNVGFDTYVAARGLGEGRSLTLIQHRQVARQQRNFVPQQIRFAIN
ncbi:MAG: hypothetical protein AAGD25_37755 [Cyanobacteria bacterium P01_F01_bin.150]